MAETALAVFALSLLLSIVVAVRTESRARRGEKRDERREVREVEEVADRRRGRPVLLPRGVSGGPTARTVTHDYLIRNAGHATISALWLWIVNAAGETVSEVAGGRGIVVAQDEATAVIGVAVHQPLPEGELTLADPSGEVGGL